MTCLIAPSNLDLYATAEHLPHVLLDPKIKDSYSVTETAFQRALGTPLSRWDWLEQEVSSESKTAPSSGYPSLPETVPGVASTQLSNGHDGPVKRPEHGVFSLAMVGGGRVHGAAHPVGT